MSAEIWFKRDRLEFHVIACLCAGVAVRFPYPDEAAMAWGRILKDAVTNGELEAQLNGNEPNNQSAVDRKSLRAFATLKNDSDLLQFCDKWKAAHECSTRPPPAPIYPDAPPPKSDGQRAKKEQARHSGGRKPGSGSYRDKDRVLWKKMKAALDQDKAVSIWEAAGQFEGEAPGHGTPDSTRRRLVKGYKDWVNTP